MRGCARTGGPDQFTGLESSGRQPSSLQSDAILRNWNDFAYEWLTNFERYVIYNYETRIRPGGSFAALFGHIVQLPERDR